MENKSSNLDILQLEGLKISPESAILSFIILLLIYIFIIVSNISLVVLIFMDRSLHQPMYLLFCNLSINDVFGATAIIPRLLSDMLIPSTERYIHYIDCVLQAFCAQIYAGASHTVLMVMAFDQYVAVCNPLRYATIMTNRMVVKLSVSAWGVVFVMVLILIGLSVRLSRCRSIIAGPFCDNASLFKLSCESILINNIYGLSYTAILLGSSIASSVFTYLRITMVCLSSKNKVLNNWALQTCATHLAVLMILSGVVNVILHRFPDLSEQRKLVVIVFHVVPPAMNAFIYGLQIKAVRQKVFVMFTRNTLKVSQ